MNVDFYNTSCQTPNITHVTFGLCDDGDGKESYVDFEDKKKWGATVENPNGISLTFTAIDKCVIGGDNQNQNIKRCDAMITTTEHLYFIELKSTKELHSKRAEEQLISTIKLFRKLHPEKFSKYRHKKAYHCNNRHNKKRGGFQEIMSCEQRRFWDSYEFRLDISCKITFK